VPSVAGLRGLVSCWSSACPASKGCCPAARIESYLTAKYALYTPTVAAPNISPHGGPTAAVPAAYLDCATPGATIRCTLDDSEPTETSPECAGPLSINGTTRVRAKAFLSGWNSSAETVATFLDGAAFTPASVPNLSLWVRADAGLAAAAVTPWRDQGAASNDLLQANALSQPVVTFDSTSRMPVLSFDGVDDSLLFRSRLASIRTVFWVVRRSPAATPNSRYLLGDAINYDFSSDGTTKIWTTSYTNASILNGQTRLNGGLVNGTTTDRPTSLSVISLVTTGPVVADAFGRDRVYGNRWWGDLGELVIYDRALSTAEVRSVEEFLAGRYGITLAP
jgi:hypothetical protein